MKKRIKKVLTVKRAGATLRRMPAQPEARKKRSKAIRTTKNGTLEYRYNQFFTPPPTRGWHQEEDTPIFDRTSPLKWVPSETTYGINEA